MADEEDEVRDEEEEGEGNEEDEGKKKKLSGRTLVLFIVLPLVVISGIGFGALKLFGGGEEPVDPLAEARPRLQDPTEVVFTELPVMLVNIRTADNRTTFLSLKVSLELDKDEDLSVLNAAMPRIEDKFQVYLRELRLEDLTGAAGTQRVKEELLRRVNIAADPVRVNAVLIREMVVQ